MRGYSVLAKYAFESQGVENDLTVPLTENEGFCLPILAVEVLGEKSGSRYQD